MDGHLHVILIGHGKAGINGRRGGAPVFVQFEAAGPGLELFAQRIVQRRIDHALHRALGVVAAVAYGKQVRPAHGVVDVEQRDLRQIARNRPAAAVTLGEDKAINIKDILTANFADLDGSENRTLTLENPAGSGGTIRYSVDGGTTWLPLASGAAPVTVRIAKTGVDGQSGTISSFDDIRIAAPQNFAGDIGSTNKIKITITAADTDSDGAACDFQVIYKK